MGKKAKEHRRKVEKRNRKIQQEKQMMKRQIDKLFEQRLDTIKNDPNIGVKLGDKDLPFSIVEDSNIFPNTKINPIVNELNFEDSNNDQFVDIEVVDENEPEVDSAGFTIEDRELDPTTETTDIGSEND